MSEVLGFASALQGEEERLQQAKEKAFEQAKARPTTANRRAYKKACKDMEDFLKAAAEPETVEVFNGLPEVLEYLESKSWKISQSTLYEHRNQGKIQAESAGVFLKSIVDEYARLHLRKKDGTPGGAIKGNLQEVKQRAEIARIDADARTRELKLRTMLGELIPKSQVEIELAERATNLKNYFNAIARSSAGRIIKIVEGDPQKAPELITWMLAMYSKAFDNYGRPIKGLEEEE